LPPEQSSEQAPERGHVNSQLPPEQSAVHGATVHELEQLPDEHEQVPPEHEVLDRAAGVPGSEMGGPPLGEPPVVPPDPLHAAVAANDRVNVAVSLRQMIMAFLGGGNSITCWTSRR